MNYTELSAAISSYTEDVNFASTDIDGFIKQAEQRIYNSVHLLPLRKNVTGTTTLGNKYLAVPTDFLAPFSLAVIHTDTSQAFLVDKDVSYIRECYPNPASTGEPQHYALFDSTSILLGPTPDASYGVEFHYFYIPESIVTAGTTWLGDHFDSTLLYGALVEAYTFMKGEADLLAQYDKQYQTAMILLKQFGDGKLRQDTYRSGQVTYPVR